MDRHNVGWESGTYLQLFSDTSEVLQTYTLRLTVDSFRLPPLDCRFYLDVIMYSFDTVVTHPYSVYTT